MVNEPASTIEAPRAEEAPREAREPRGDRGPDRDDRGDRGDRRGGGGGRFGARRRGCEFCIEKIEGPDYKDVSMLRRYITDRGKLEPRRKVGTCAKHQRRVALAVKRARIVALLPYTAEHVRVSGVQGGRSASPGGRR
jgi:small subunit ribosomal protein S18